MGQVGVYSTVIYTDCSDHMDPSEERIRQSSKLAPFSFSMQHGGENLSLAPHIFTVALVKPIFHQSDRYVSNTTYMTYYNSSTTALRVS